MTVRWGVLSTARINDAFLGGVAASDDAEVVAVASRDAGRAREYADERGIARAHGSYEALLADPDVEAVYISLPNGMHLQWSQAALGAGKHVLCEKPLGRDAAAVAAAFDLADAHGLRLSEGFMWRHHPQTIELARLVADGAVGTPRAVRAHFGFLLADPDDVRLRADLEGGALMDLGCYCVSAARLLAGEPVQAAGVQVTEGDPGSEGRGGVDVSFAGALGFAGGVVADLYASFRAAPGFGLVVVGDAGTVTVEDPWHIREPGLQLRDAGGAHRIEIAAADSYRLQVDDVSRAVRGAGELRLGRADAVGQARAIEALYAAAERATPIA